MDVHKEEGQKPVFVWDAEDLAIAYRKATRVVNATRIENPGADDYDLGRACFADGVENGWTLYEENRAMRQQTQAFSYGTIFGAVVAALTFLVIHFFIGAF